MVKQLDESPTSELIDHVGWRLLRVARQWKTEFETAMAERGLEWLTQAQGSVVGQLREGGVTQSELALRLGISKQAVQQFVDSMEGRGVVRREVDPADKRGRVVQLTAAGAEALEASNAVKREIEARYREVLEDAGFAGLMAGLRGLDGK